MGAYSTRSLAVLVGMSVLGGVAAVTTGTNGFAVLGVVAGVVIAGIMARR